ncbi:hypothetical protein [Methanobrevibacter sp.]
MDKRWIAILLILIAGLISMYLIVDASHTVGNAVTVIDDVSVTVPPGYKTDVSHSENAKLVNGEGNRIYIECTGKGNHSVKDCKKEIKSITNKGLLEVINQTNNTFKTKNATSGKITSYFFFEKHDRSFMLRLSNFDNDTIMKKDIDFIIDNIKPDFKQNRA